MKKTPDHSKEYVKKNDSIPITITKIFPDYDVDPLGGAGDMNSCAKDMAARLITCFNL